MLFTFVTLVSKILIILSVIGLLFNWIRGGIDEGSAILRFLPQKFGSVKLIGVFLIVVSITFIVFFTINLNSSLLILIQPTNFLIK